MAGNVIPIGSVPSVPDVYFQFAPSADATQREDGIGIATIAASAGPVMVPTQVTRLDQITSIFGTGDGPDTAGEMLRGGVDVLYVQRAGIAGTGTAATKVLNDSAAAPALDLAAKDIGTRNLAVTVVDNADTVNRDLALYRVNGDGTFTKLATYTFAKGATGIGETGNAAAALASSPYVTAVVHAAYAGTKLLANVAAPSAFTPGTNPTINATAYLNAAYGSEGLYANVHAFDTEDTSIFASLATWAAGLEGKGVFRIVVLGDAESITADPVTRANRAKTYNVPNLVYAAHSFRRKGPPENVTTKVLVEGAQFAGRIAGLVAAYDIDNSLAGAVLDGAVDIPDPLDLQTEQPAFVTAGAIGVRLNGRGQVSVLNGQTTYQTYNGDRSLRWGKILRVMRRYRFMRRLALAWDDMKRAGVNNDAHGMGEAISVGNGIANEMIRPGYFSAVTFEPSDTNPQTDDLTYIDIYLYDNDVMERIVGVLHWT